MFIAHGYAEHLEWYSGLAQALARDKMLIFGHDHLGHGLSDGQRGYIKDLEIYVNHVFFHCTKVKAVFKGVPCYIYGHSMGGLLAIRYVRAWKITATHFRSTFLIHIRDTGSCEAIIKCVIIMFRASIRNPGFFRGLVLEGPLIRLPATVMTPLQHLGVKVAAWFLPQLPTTGTLSMEAVTSDPVMQNKIMLDPLRFKGGVKIGMAAAFMDSVTVSSYYVQNRVIHEFLNF